MALRPRTQSFFLRVGTFLICLTLACLAIAVQMHLSGSSWVTVSVARSDLLLTSLLGIALVICVDLARHRDLIVLTPHRGGPWMVSHVGAYSKTRLGTPMWKWWMKYSVLSALTAWVSAWFILSPP